MSVRAEFHLSPPLWATWLGTALDEAWDVADLAEVLSFPLSIVRDKAVRYGVPLRDVDGLPIRISRRPVVRAG